MMAIACADAP